MDCILHFLLLFFLHKIPVNMYGKDQRMCLQPFQLIVDFPQLFVCAPVIGSTKFNTVKLVILEDK